MISAIILFVYWPVNGEQINITTGLNRIVFCMVSVLIVISFYKLKVNRQFILNKPLKYLGVATYGIYLIHPIMMTYFGTFFKKIGINNNYIVIVTIVLITIIMALISYYYFEVKVIKIGKKITDKFQIRKEKKSDYSSNSSI